MRSIFLPVGFILVFSLVALSSISRNLFLLQLVWLLFGILFLIVFANVDWRSLFNYRWLSWGFYLFTIFLLLVAYLAGPTIRGTRGWLIIGPFNFQPVELVKIALIIAYAQYFSRRHLIIARWKTILTSFILFIVPAGLVALQPDLGSALILFGIWFGFLLTSGLPQKRVLAAFLLFVIVGVFGWHYGLKEYHRQRILGVFYPEQNVLTINYSVNQSKIAIGSAGLLGKGYGQGSETQLGFLTDPATDFILAALIEEWGIVVGLLVVAALLVLIVRILRIGSLTRLNFEKFICLGTAMVFGLHFLLNAGSTVGIFPVVGVTFPFLSYGGSSLLTNFFLLAMIYAIAKQS
jgi:rod shape determining protein RodA